MKVPPASLTELQQQTSKTKIEHEQSLLAGSDVRNKENSRPRLGHSTTQLNTRTQPQTENSTAQNMSNFNFTAIITTATQEKVKGKRKEISVAAVAARHKERGASRS